MPPQTNDGTCCGEGEQVKETIRERLSFLCRKCLYSQILEQKYQLATGAWEGGIWLCTIFFLGSKMYFLNSKTTVIGWRSSLES